MRRSFSGTWRTLPVLRRGAPGFAVFLCVAAATVYAQGPTQDELAKKVQLLTDAVGRAQEQLEQSQRQLGDLRRRNSCRFVDHYVSCCFESLQGEFIVGGVWRGTYN